MCQTLHFEGRVIETIGELRNHMPRLVKEPVYTSIPDYPECCLCPIDLVKTGRLNRFVVQMREDGDYDVTGVKEADV